MCLMSRNFGRHVVFEILEHLLEDVGQHEHPVGSYTFYFVEPYHVEYFYEQHSSQIFILST